LSSVDPNVLIALAIMLGPAINGLFTIWLKRVADRATEVTQKAAIAASTNAAIAQAQASEAARQLIIAARQSDQKLDTIVGVSAATHEIVNSQRTAMEKKIDDLQTLAVGLQARITELLSKIPTQNV
jgi:hypothetical protein